VTGGRPPHARAPAQAASLGRAGLVDHQAARAGLAAIAAGSVITASRASRIGRDQLD